MYSGELACRCVVPSGRSVMSENTVAEAELSADAEWTNPDWARLTDAIHRRVVPFVASATRFRGSVVVKGTEKITRTYDTVEKWTDALTADVNSADCWLSASSNRSISLRAQY